MDEIEKLVYKSILDKLKKKLSVASLPPHHSYLFEVMKCEQGPSKSEIRMYIYVEMGAMI